VAGLESGRVDQQNESACVLTVSFIRRDRDRVAAQKSLVVRDGDYLRRPLPGCDAAARDGGPRKRAGATKFEIIETLSKTL